MFEEYNDRKRMSRAMQEEIAITIKHHPEMSYNDIAEEFGISQSNVQRIAAKYDVQRNPRKFWLLANSCGMLNYGRNNKSKVI